MTFKHQVIRGSAYLSFRLAAGAVIGIVGISLLTRFIGPANYGMFTAAHAVLVYLATLTECGIGVYLIRLERDSPDESHQALTLLLLFSIVGVLLAVAAAPLLARYYDVAEVRTAVLVLGLGLPLVHIVKVPMARLERNLDYRRVAVIELVGNLVYYVVALPLAYRGAGIGAPLAGWWAQQLTQFVQVYCTGYRPRLIWRPALIKRMLSFGVPYSGSQLILAVRDLVNPLVVGRILGPAGVGYVALALRIVQQLGFVGTATSRISVAAFARVGDDPARLARAITEGMFLQIIAIGPLLCAFSLLAPFAITFAFGPTWLPVLLIFPWLAVAAMIDSMFQLQSSALTVFGMNYKQALAQLVRLALLVVFATFFVSRMGGSGYGLAALASLPLFCLLVHIWVRARTAPIYYGRATVWLVAFSLPLFADRLGNVVWLSLLAPLLWSPTRHQLLGLAEFVTPRRVPTPP